MNDYYLILIHGGVEIETLGPFDSAERLMSEARREWSNAKPEYDSIFHLTVPHGADVAVGEFSNAQLEDEG